MLCGRVNLVLKEDMHPLLGQIVYVNYIKTAASNWFFEWRRQRSQNFPYVLSSPFCVCTLSCMFVVLCHWDAVIVA